MRKYFHIILVICVCAGFGLFFLLHNKGSQKKYIAFYSLSNETVQAFQTVLKDRFSDIEQQFEWRIIDPAVPVSAFIEQNPKTAFVISSDNKSLFEARSFFIRHKEETFQPLPSTFFNNIFVNDAADRFYAFPLLINPVKLSCNAVIADKLGLYSYISLEDFERLPQAAQGTSVHFPFICAGGEDETLFALISAVAAMHGNTIKPEDFAALSKDADLRTACPPVLKAALETLVAWRVQGLLHPEWYRLIQGDIEVFMKFNSTALAALPLSSSRQLSREELEHYITMQLPLPQALNRKNMPADVIVWAQTAPHGNKSASDSPLITEICNFLYLQETNEALARATGLAPVFSSAQTTDAEASSGRYWVASSNMVLPFFDNCVCTTATEKIQLAESIRRYLEVNGVGY